MLLRSTSAVVVILLSLLSSGNCLFPERVNLEVVVETCASLLEQLQSPLVSKIVLKRSLICNWKRLEKFKRQIRIKHRVEISSEHQKEFTTLEVSSLERPAILVSKGGRLIVNRAVLEVDGGPLNPKHTIDAFEVERGGSVQIMNSMLLFKSSPSRAGGTFPAGVDASATQSGLEQTVFLEKSTFGSERVILCRSVLGYKNQNVKSIAETLLQASKPVRWCSQISKTVVMFSQEVDVVAVAARIGLLALFFTSLQVVFGVKWRRRCFQIREQGGIELKEEGEGTLEPLPSQSASSGSDESPNCFCGSLSDDNKADNSTAEIPTTKNKGNENSPDIGQGLLLELESVLGHSKYTRVYKGSYYGTPVAVKVSEKVGSKKQAVNEPLEVKILRHLRHPNLVGLVTSVKHVPSQDTSISKQQQQASMSSPRGTKFCYQTFIVMEYCDRGTLYEAIKQCRVQPTHCATQSVGMTNECVIHCAVEISRAMEKVHCKRVVHRALHPKNILLKTNANDPRGFTCKVGGFGSSYRLSSGSSSIQDNKVKNIAIAAPEVLSGGQLSLASDVLSNNELRRTVLSGMRPSIPERVPPTMAELIRSCWAADPDDRPSFTSITLQLEEFIKIESVRLKLDQPGGSGDTAGSSQSEPPPPMTATCTRETLIPGNSYIHIQFHPSKVEKEQPRRKQDYLPRHSRHESCRRHRRTRAKQRSTSVLPETSEEAFVRSVDDLLKRSRSSDSKNELRQFLSTITLDCDAKYNHLTRDY